MTYNPSTNLLSVVASNGGGYSLRGTLANTTTNPASNTTYYGGGAASNTLSATATSRRIYFPKAGTIKACYGFFYQTAAVGAANATLYIRVNNSTDILVTTASHTGTTSTLYSNTGLSTAVSQGSYIEFKWVTPASGWTTPPTNMTSEFTIYVE
jgi:hypothetical protein